MSKTIAVDASGGTFMGLLGITFIILKLTHVIDWSWWLVLLPLYLGMAVALAVLVIILLIVLVASK